MRDLQAQIISDLHVKATIDSAAEIRWRVAFLRDYLLYLGARGYVLGVSGGQDSTLAGRLAQMAVEQAHAATGRSYTLVAVRLPYGVQLDEADALMALDFIRPSRTVRIDIKPVVDAAAAAFAEGMGVGMTDYIKGNTKARERMKVQYDIAGQLGLLVVGTDHAAESVTGFFTKYGDGACDVEPLTGLSKRQGRQLLAALKAAPALYEKTPTADLLDERPGQPDEAELGMSYDLIDDYLEGRPIATHLAEALERRYLATRHKRRMPVTPYDTWWCTE